jgi:hypothetical protein
MHFDFGLIVICLLVVNIIINDKDPLKLKTQDKAKLPE